MILADSDPIFYDTETCGLHGPIVLIQYAIGDGPIELFCPWKETVWDTIDLIEMMMNHRGGTIGFNLSFDHFHMCQMYTTLLLIQNKDAILGDCIIEYALAEPEARLGPCLKPQRAFDIMLHARKGEYQSTMDRKAIRIRRIPTPLAWLLSDELTSSIHLKDVYFARKKDPTERWKVYDIFDEDDEIIPEFKDVVLKFAPSSALKALAQDVLNIDHATKFAEVDLDKRYRPVEQGWAPFALAPFKNKDGNRCHPSSKNWYGKWPQMISNHITHWGYNSLARKYAKDDVVYTRDLYKYFKSPPMDDDDSILACMVGAVRWRGYSLDIEGMKGLKKDAQETLSKSPHNFNSNTVCRDYLALDLDATQLMTMMSNGKLSTKGIILEEIAKWGMDTVCEDCGGMSCDNCQDGLIISDPGTHPAAVKSQQILDFRHAKKEMENYDKFLDAGRFHASFKVIGTLSSRMAGSDGLNAQGIKREKRVRKCFPLADDGLVLCGGDFSGFEVSLMDASYGDPELRKDLQSTRPCHKCEGHGKVDDTECSECSGSGILPTKIHALFGQYLFPPKTYNEIIKTSGLAGSKDLYGRSKNGMFALAYGGEAFTLATRVGIPEEIGEEAYERFTNRYTKFGDERAKISAMFCSMRQPKGIGTAVEWHDPAEYIESMFGFKRYFTLENMICKTLFGLAESPPKAWYDIKVKVVRRDREQTATGAVRSALFGAAFQIQAANMRAAGNHRIQSTGAQMTKKLQCNIWDVQPTGINDWVVQPMNIHDEIMTPTDPDYIKDVSKIVDDYVIEYRKQVPLLEIEWGDHFKSWAEK